MTIEISVLLEIASVAVNAALALLVGFAIQRGSVCAVAAARQLIVRRRVQRTKSFAIAVCWSAIVILPLSWLFPHHVTLSNGYPISWLVVISAVLYGTGAYLNTACAFGTLVGLTRGSMSYLATIAGVVFGVIITAQIELVLLRNDALTASPVSEPSAGGIVVIAISLLVVLRAMYRHYRVSLCWQSPWAELVSVRRWRPTPAMAILGVTGGLLYATAGEWTYLAVLSERAAGLVNSTATSSDVGLWVAAGSLVFGAILAAHLSGHFVWVRPKLDASPRMFVGGALMSGSAALLPGGNDELLLYGLPSLVPYAIVAYGAMSLSLYLLIFLDHRFKSPSHSGRACSG